MSTRMRNVGLLVGGTLVLAMMIGGAIGIAGFLQTGARSCDDMARAAADAGPDVRRVDIVVGILSNSGVSASEAEQFVASALASSGPEDVTVATVTIVNGDRALAESACVGRPLYVAPSDADLAAYATASDEARSDVAEALDRQYGEQVDQVAAAVGELVGASPAPTSGDAGAFDIWPFIAASDGDVSALGSFAVGGDNCLTLDRPAARLADGGTAIADRVEQCVATGDLTIASAKSVLLEGSSAISLTGGQAEAQSAVIAALCEHATTSGCQSKE